MLRIYAKVSEGVVGREIEIKSILAAMHAGKHILLEGLKTTVLYLARHLDNQRYIFVV